jgi:hypothetical protein
MNNPSGGFVHQLSDIAPEIWRRDRREQRLVHDDAVRLRGRGEQLGAVMPHRDVGHHEVP